jgi:hypothetical protein
MSATSTMASAKPASRNFIAVIKVESKLPAKESKLPERFAAAFRQNLQTADLERITT